MADETLSFDIIGKNDKLKKAIKDSENDFKNFGKSAEKATESINISLSSIKSGFAALGVGKFIKDCNTAYGAQIEQERKLATVMRQRMRATAEDINSIKALTSAQQDLGIVGDQIQLAGAQQLATFASQKSTLETLIPAMNNLIAQQKGYNATTSDAVSVATRLGKGLKGMTGELTEVGITFSDAQEQILKYGTEEQKAATLAQVITDNVGEMNSALRNLPTGQTAALANDFTSLQEQIGETFQPLITTVIPIASQGLRDLQPFVEGLGLGFSAISDVLNDMNPETRTALVYTIAATSAFKLLNGVMGGPMAKLMAIGALIAFVAGGFKSLYDTGETASVGFDDAALSADGAAKSTDKLAKSADGVGETVKSSLAGFDEITKLSGGKSTLASAIATADDVDNINAAAEAAELLKDINSETMGVFDGLGLLKDPLIGVFEELRPILERLQPTAKGLLDAFVDLGEDALPVAADLLELSVIPLLSSLEKLLEGDLNGAVSDFSVGFVGALEAIAKFLDEKFDLNTTGFVEELRNELIDLGAIDTTVKSNVTNDGHHFSDFVGKTPHWDSSRIYERLRESRKVDTTFIPNSTEMLDFTSFHRNLINSASTLSPDNITTPTTSKGVYDAVTAAINSSGAGTGGTSGVATVYVQLDGETIARATAEMDSDDTYRGNGRRR